MAALLVYILCAGHAKCHYYITFVLFNQDFACCREVLEAWDGVAPYLVAGIFFNYGYCEFSHVYSCESCVCDSYFWHFNKSLHITILNLIILFLVCSANLIKQRFDFYYALQVYCEASLSCHARKSRFSAPRSLCSGASLGLAYLCSRLSCIIFFDSSMCQALSQSNATYSCTFYGLPAPCLSIL